ncbi:MAG: EAL domain-containing protein [Bacillota bacterium]
MRATALNVTTLIRERSFFSEFQPLWCSEKESIFGYEAFIRTEPGINPESIFQYGRNYGLLYDFDTDAISNAIKEYPYSYFEKYFLFVNVFPSTLVHPEFPNFIQRLMTNHPEIKRRIVFEINKDTREESYWKDEIFSSRLLLLKSFGFLIAFDDLTLSEVSLNKIIKFRPNFAKLDPACSKEVLISLGKQEILIFFQAYLHDKAIIVLEGIETEEELNKAKKVGVPLLQGYYFSKPQRL